MKIQLPDGKRINLDENISLEEKKKIVNELLEKWCSVCNMNWDSNSIKFFLDALANYLVWHKEQKEKWKEDKEILSIKKIEKMTGKRKSNTINFTDLPKFYKETLFGERGAEK